MKRMNFQAKNEELSNHRATSHFQIADQILPRSTRAAHGSTTTKPERVSRELLFSRKSCDVTPSEQPCSRPQLAARGPSRRRRSRHPAARKGAGDESRARRPPRASDACDRARDRRTNRPGASRDPDSNTMGDSSREARCEAWEDEQRRLDESWVSTPCPCVDDAKAPGQVRERPDSPSDMARTRIHHESSHDARTQTNNHD
jgi:hypothetical protein